MLILTNKIHQTRYHPRFQDDGRWVPSSDSIPSQALTLFASNFIDELHKYAYVVRCAVIV